MLPAARRAALAVLSAAFLAPPAAAQSVPVERVIAEKRTRFEDEIIRRLGERAVRPGDTEREVWVKHLTKAFPNQVGPGLTDADFGQWYGLLSGGGGVWTRNSAPRQVEDLFERVAKRFGRGKNDGVGRDEFVGYAREFLTPDRSPPWKAVDSVAESEKLFRGLDRDGSGALDQSEWTDGLTAGAAQTDRNRDGRIDPAEYRAYLDGRLAVAAQAAESQETARKGGNQTPDPRAAPPPTTAPTPSAPAASIAPRREEKVSAVPAWFLALDTDRDGQVGLYEWKRGGLPLDQFAEMDQNGDGLLPLDEFRRFVRDHGPDAANIHAPGEETAKAGRRR
jgi:hypothetical protein